MLGWMRWLHTKNMTLVFPGGHRESCSTPVDPPLLPHNAA